MEVLLTIPDDLARYVEYIPSEALPEVIIDIVRKDILSRHAVSSNSGLQQHSSADLTEILNILSKMQLDGIPAQNVQRTHSNNVAPEPAGERQQPVSIDAADKDNASLIEIEDGEELGDLLDLLK